MEILHFKDMGDTTVVSECSWGHNLVNDNFVYVYTYTYTYTYIYGHAHAHTHIHVYIYVAIGQYRWFVWAIVVGIGISVLMVHGRSAYRRLGSCRWGAGWDLNGLAANQVFPPLGGQSTTDHGQNERKLLANLAETDVPAFAEMKFSAVAEVQYRATRTAKTGLWSPPGNKVGGGGSWEFEETSAGLAVAGGAWAGTSMDSKQPDFSAIGRPVHDGS